MGKRFPIAAAILAALAYGAPRVHRQPPNPAREIAERPCLNCGTPTKHKKGFCSAECCKAYRANPPTEDKD